MPNLQIKYTHIYNLLNNYINKLPNYSLRNYEPINRVLNPILYK